MVHPEDEEAYPEELVVDPEPEIPPKRGPIVGPTVKPDALNPLVLRLTTRCLPSFKSAHRFAHSSESSGNPAFLHAFLQYDGIFVVGEVKPELAFAARIRFTNALFCASVTQNSKASRLKTTRPGSFR